MKMFKFSFFTDDKENEKEKVDEEDKWLPCEEVKIKDALKLEEILDCNDNNVFSCAECPDINYISANAIVDMIEENLLDNSILKAEGDHSDLVPAVYEGGLKIWECTYDLAKYICMEKADLRNKLVLDLGCGAGILGILSLLKESEVYFQDYNAEVIKYVTITNVISNLQKRIEDEKFQKCKFYSGDWQSFADIIGDDPSLKFDYILTSETIYNEKSYSKLHAVFKSCLKPNGVIFLAAKTYYFGVGGGLRTFQDFLKSEDIFNSEVCWSCSEGVQREILKITFITQ